MMKDYAVKELPFRSGTRRRTLGRFELLHEAWTVAECASSQGRLIQIELNGLVLVEFLGGKRLPPSSTAAAPSSAL